MSKRFGRARRRKMREALVKLETDLVESRRLCMQLERRSRESAREVELIHRTVESLAGKNSALLTPQHVVEREDQFGYSMQRLGDWKGSPWSGSEAVPVSDVVMHKLRTKVDRDSLRRGMIVSVSFPGRGHLELFLTEEATEYETARESMALHVSRRLVEALAKSKVKA